MSNGTHYLIHCESGTSPGLAGNSLDPGPCAFPSTLLQYPEPPSGTASATSAQADTVTYNLATSLEETKLPACSRNQGLIKGANVLLSLRTPPPLRPSVLSPPDASPTSPTLPLVVAPMRRSLTAYSPRHRRPYAISSSLQAALETSRHPAVTIESLIPADYSPSPLLQGLQLPRHKTRLLPPRDAQVSSVDTDSYPKRPQKPSDFNSPVHSSPALNPHPAMDRHLDVSCTAFSSSPSSIKNNNPYPRSNFDILTCQLSALFAAFPTPRISPFINATDPSDFITTLRQPNSHLPSIEVWVIPAHVAGELSSKLFAYGLPLVRLTDEKADVMLWDQNG
ncbi:hypothetical protein DL98DRAFT_540202 [Cadophora sp. DSE1049]|nr:hypothetical protein DL98DRAFT_540202 [Cadophora sp. DSE1049]